MSLVFVAASAILVPPRKFGSASEALVVPYWSGRATEGMSLGFTESSGTVVPSFAISKRSPPLLGPDSGGDIVAADMLFEFKLREGCESLLMRRWSCSVCSC